MKKLVIFIVVIMATLMTFGAATLDSGIPTDLEILVTAQNLYDYDVLTVDNLVALDILTQDTFRELDLIIPLHNFSGTATPEASMDVTEGYEVGSFWYDTTNDVMYSCIDATTDTAVWYTVGVQAIEPVNNYAATTAPGTVNSDQGYSVGSIWIDTTADNFYICLDDTAGTGVWTVALGDS